MLCQARVSSIEVRPSHCAVAFRASRSADVTKPSLAAMSTAVRNSPNRV